MTELEFATHSPFQSFFISAYIFDATSTHTYIAHTGTGTLRSRAVSCYRCWWCQAAFGCVWVRLFSRYLLDFSFVFHIKADNWDKAATVAAAAVVETRLYRRSMHHFMPINFCQKLADVCMEISWKCELHSRLQIIFNFLKVSTQCKVMWWSRENIYHAIIEDQFQKDVENLSERLARLKSALVEFTFV